jgi:hypothetical protein
MFLEVIDTAWNKTTTAKTGKTAPVASMCVSVE